MADTAVDDTVSAGMTADTIAALLSAAAMAKEAEFEQPAQPALAKYLQLTNAIRSFAPSPEISFGPDQSISLVFMLNGREVDITVHDEAYHTSVYDGESEDVSESEATQAEAVREFLVRFM